MIYRLSFTCLISVLLFSCTNPQQKVIRIKNGNIDLVNHNFETGGTVIIVGEADYYPSQFLTVEQIHSGDFHPIQVQFPMKLSDQLPNKDAKGHGTYHFKIRLPQNEFSYGLFIEGIFSSYQLYIGSHLEDKVGKIGTNIHSQTPMVRPEIVNLHLEEGFNDVILQVSNFHENHSQISYPLKIGEIHSLYRDRFRTYGYDFSFSFLYLILSIGFIFIFLFHRKPDYMIFSGYCFVLAYRFLIKNSKFLLEIMDSQWIFFYKSEYVTYYLTSSLVPILLCHIFKVPKHKVIVNVLAGIGIGTSLFTFCSPVAFFSRFAYLYHYYSIGLVMFSLFITLYFHLFKKGTKHILLVAGVLIYATCFLYDVIMSLLYYTESYYYNWGLAILTMLMAIVFIRIQFFKERKLNLRSLSNTDENPL